MILVMKITAFISKSLWEYPHTLIHTNTGLVSPNSK